MTQGFESDNSKAKVTIYTDEVKKLLKKYKKIKKYMKSPMYTLKVMEGNEKIVSELLEETDEENQQSTDEKIEE
jgi:hypothetical protein